MCRRRCIYLVLFGCMATIGYAQPTHHTLDSLYNVLDHVIGQADSYIHMKLKDIDRKKEQWTNSSSPEQRHEKAVALFHEYRSFDNDSALHYLEECRRLAVEQKNDEWLMMALLRIGHQYVVAGYYTEALNYLSQVNPKMLTQGQLPTYYHYWSHLYRELEMYTIDTRLRDSYRQLSRAYGDSLALNSNTDTALYLQRRCITLVANGYTDEALDINTQWMQKVEKGSAGYSLMSYYRSEIMGSRQQYQQQKYWLAVSAIGEVTGCDRNLRALWKLAALLAEEDDINRSMKYIDFSWNSISEFSSHKRVWLMAPVMNNIHYIYQQKITRINRLFIWLSCVIGALAFFLMLALYYARKERRVAVRAKTELQQQNSSLEILNAQLHDSNRIKDGYIREFLQICSAYIDKIDDYRVRINRKLKANQVKDLLLMTGSEQIRKDERQKLMGHFDSVFLHLFPSYIDDFNRLLEPDTKVKPDEPGSLNTTLRIFALIRLGIDDSSEIAAFLGYTANTIYNYRSRIKQHALGNRDDFETKVKQIGFDCQTLN